MATNVNKKPVEDVKSPNISITFNPKHLFIFAAVGVLVHYVGIIPVSYLALITYASTTFWRSQKSSYRSGADMFMAVWIFVMFPIMCPLMFLLEDEYREQILDDIKPLFSNNIYYFRWPLAFRNKEDK